MDGEFYISVGTHLSLFSRSDIRLRSSADPTFDFTLYDVRGRDDGGLHFRHGAPQYSYAVGYYNRNKNWGIEYGFDHIKYYLKQNQRVHMEGIIGEKYYYTDTAIVSSFVSLEHTDGANYALLKFVKWIPIAVNENRNRTLNLELKGGAGPVVPKTNSTIMGKHRDDRYKIAGFVVAAEAGLRYPFARFVFAEAGVKGAYANYKGFLIADGNGSQKWFGLHFHLSVGANFVCQQK